MARNPELEALLQAKYDLDTAAEQHKAALQREIAHGSTKLSCSRKCQESLGGNWKSRS